MAQLGSGLSSSYPTEIDTIQQFQNSPSAAPDSAQRLDAEFANDALNAIRNIETTLGAQPQGIFGSLAARLNQFIPGSGRVLDLIAFVNQTVVNVAGGVHNLGSPVVLFQVYDANTPAAAVSPDNFVITVDQTNYDMTVTFATPQSGILIISVASPLHLEAFAVSSAPYKVTIPGSVHLMATSSILWAVYDDSTPAAAAISPQGVTIHPSTFDVEFTFGVGESGVILLSAPSPNYVHSFTGQTIVPIPGTTHGLGTRSLLWAIYDANSPAAAIQPQSLTVHPTSFDVQLTFATPQSGRIILGAAVPLTGADFEIRDAGLVDRTAVRMFSLGGNLFLQPGVGDHLYVRDKTGSFHRIDIDTVNGRLGIGTIPAYQLHLSADSAAKPATSTWTVASDQKLKDVLRPFEEGLATIEQLMPVVYRYNGRGGITRDNKEQIGLIAQEVQPVAPYLIGNYKARLTPSEPEEELLSYEGHALPFVLVNAVKQLAKQVEELTTHVEALLHPPAPRTMGAEEHEIC